MTSSQKKCHKCNGSGWVRVPSSFDYGDVVPDICWRCDGTGKAREKDGHEQDAAK